MTIHSLPSNNFIPHRLEPLQIPPKKDSILDAGNDEHNLDSQEDQLLFHMELNDDEANNPSPSPQRPHHNSELQPAAKKMERLEEPVRFKVKPHSLGDKTEILGTKHVSQAKKQLPIPPRCGFTFEKVDVAKKSGDDDEKHDSPANSQQSPKSLLKEALNAHEAAEQLKLAAQVQKEQERTVALAAKNALEQQYVAETKTQIETDANAAIQNQEQSLNARHSSCCWWSILLISIPFTLYSYYSKKSAVKKNIASINAFTARTTSAIENCPIKNKTHLSKVSNLSRNLLMNPELISHDSHQITIQETSHDKLAFIASSSRLIEFFNNNPGYVESAYLHLETLITANIDNNIDIKNTENWITWLNTIYSQQIDNLNEY